MKRKIFFVLIAIMYFFMGMSNITYATETKKAIEKKIDKQGKDIKNNLKKAPQYGDKLDNVLNQYEENKNNSTGEFDAKAFNNKIIKGLVEGSILLRKYSIPLYIIIQSVLLIMISTLGAKSLEKRKIYIVSSISFTVLFIVILNIPIFAIYFQNRAVEEIVGSGGIYKALYGFISFLKSNSPVISMLLIIYGIMNIVVSRTDLPRRLQGRYMIKAALVLFITLQVLPLIVKVII